MTAAWTLASLVLTLVTTGSLLARRWFLVVTVCGDSMTPAYQPGDRVLVRRTRKSVFSRGDVVVLHLSALDSSVAPVSRPAMGAQELAIKRVAAIAGDPFPGGVIPVGQVYLLGDNPTTSLDSRTVGAVTTDHIFGMVVRPLSRSGSRARLSCPSGRPRPRAR